MNIENTWKKALSASMTVSLIYTILILIASSGGRMYFSPDDYSQVENMLYYEAQELLTEKSRKTTRWDSLVNGIQFKIFWMRAFFDWLLYTFICFLSCVLFLRLAKSNQTLNEGAQ